MTSCRKLTKESILMYYMWKYKNKNKKVYLSVLPPLNLNLSQVRFICLSLHKFSNKLTWSTGAKMTPCFHMHWTKMKWRKLRFFLLAKRSQIFKAFFSSRLTQIKCWRWRCPAEIWKNRNTSPLSSALLISPMVFLSRDNVRTLSFHWAHLTCSHTLETQT